MWTAGPPNEEGRKIKKLDNVVMADTLNADSVGKPRHAVAAPGWEFNAGVAREGHPYDDASKIIHSEV